MTDTGFSDRQAIDAPRGDAVHGRLLDYLRLLKPRVMSLSVFTALAGMIAAPADIHPLVGVVALLFIALGAGAAGALNMWYDADIDRVMSRTAMRSIPRNLVPAEEALALGLFLSGASVFCLGVLVNWTAAGLLALTIAYYILIYTMWLKRSTPQNIVIGGAAGAFPPMIGWAAASGDVTLNGILLFAIIFFWTPAHFWALALLRFRDYERAGIPMLPVVAGKQATRVQILIYAVLTALCAVAPYFTGLGGLFYLAISAVTSAVFVWLSVDVYLKREEHAANKAAKRLFSYSILYLFVIFAAILAEHALGLV